MMRGDEDFGWAETFVAEQATAAIRFAGYQNHNYRVDRAGRSYLIRVPIPNREVMDLRRIDETRMLKYLEHTDLHVPRALYISKSQGFAVHSWITGRRLYDVYVDDQRMPDWLPAHLGTQMAKLHKIDPGPFADDCLDLGASPDTRQFFLSNYMFDCGVHRRLLPTTADLYRKLGIPEAPFRRLDELVRALTPRPFVICHSDIHRKNIVLRLEEQDLAIVDWELALVGDPLYDIAVQFHKMLYAPDQESIFIEHYIGNAGAQFTPANVRSEVDVYLKLERVKSAVIDAYRARGDLRTGTLSRAARQTLARRYARKLDRARAVWFDPLDLRPSDPASILDTLSAG